MNAFDPVEFRSTIVRLNPRGHAALTRWAKNAKMKKGEFVKHLMNECIRQYHDKGTRPDWMKP